MTSSSSLYGTPPNQDVSSTNSTSLYGGAATPIPDSSGNLVVRGDLLVLSGNILTTATTGNIFPTNATTVNIGTAGTSVNIGADTGTTTINNNLVVDGDVTAEGGTFGNITVGVVDNNTIDNATGALTLSSGVDSIVLNAQYVSNPNASAYLFNSPTTVVAFDSATSLTMGDTTGTTTIRNDLSVQGTGTFTGDITATGGTFGNVSVGVVNNNTINNGSGTLLLSSTTGDLGLTGIDTLYTDQTSFNLLNAPTTITAFDSATTLNLGDTTGTTFIRNDVTVGGDLKINGNDIKSNGGTVAITLSGNDVVIADDLTITGNNLNLAQSTIVGYDESNNRNYRPTVRSTTGNSSGFRVEAPNATTSASANLTVFNTNDPDNGKFMSFQANGSTGAPFGIRTGEYTAGVLSASGDFITFSDGTTAYAQINPAGPTNGNDLTTKNYVDGLIPTVASYDTNVVSTTGGVELDLREIIGVSYNIVGSTKFLGGTNVTIAETAPNEITITAPDINTTYNIDATTTTGGANLNLNGSDASVDSVAIKGSGATTVTRTDANTITISSTDTNTTYTQDVSSTTGGANLNLVGSDSTTDTVKFAGGTNVSVVATNASTMTINATDTNTTYDFNATSTTGGVNLNLVGSDATTDTVKISSGTGVTASYVSGTEVSVAIGQAVGTTNNVQFNSVRTPTINANTGVSFVDTSPGGATYATVNQFGPAVSTDLITKDYLDNNAVTSVAAGTGIGVSGSTGAVTISNTGVTSLAAGTYLSVNASTGSVTVSTNATNANTASTIVARDASGNFSAGTITANLASGTRTLGQHYGTQSATWTPPATGQTTMTGQNGFYASSSSGGANGYGSTIQSRYYSGDTTLGTNTTATFTGGSATGTNSAPGALANGQVLTSLNADGYATTGWASAIATGTQTPTGVAIFPAQLQFYSREAFADNGTNVTAAGTGMRVRLFNAATTLTAANRVTAIDHTTTTATYKAATFNIQPASSTNNYATFGATTGSINQDTLTLKNNAATTTYATFNSTSASLNGDTVNLNNTAGTSTWATFATGGATIRTAGPLNIQRTSAVAASPAGEILRLSRTDVTGPQDNDGIDFRLSVGGTSTNANFARFDGVYKSSGLNEIGMSVSTDSFVTNTDRIYVGTRESTKIQCTPAGGGTLSTRLTVDNTKITAAVPFVFPSYTAAQANAITGAIGWQIAISDSASGSNPNGMMAFWDTTNARWSYIHDNSAV